MLRVGLVGLVMVAVATGLSPMRRPIVTGTSSAVSAVWDTWAEWASALRDEASEIPDPVPATTIPPPATVESRAVLLIVGDGAGGAGFALLVQPPDDGPELILIPQTLLVQVPGFGEFSMAEALMFGGPDLAGLALSNEMGIRIDDLAPLSARGLSALGDDLVVDVPVELFVEEDDGSRRLIAAGTQRLSIDLVELLLVEQGTGNQFDWLRRQEAVWEGALRAIESDPEVAVLMASGSADPSAASALLLAIAADPSIGAPPIDRVAIGASRNAMVLATERFAGYLHDHLGHLALSEGRRPRVEILNGNGTAGSGIPVATVLVAEGFYVFRSGNADRFDYETSLIIAQGEDAVEAARAAAEALGVDNLVLEGRAPSGVVDISIIVGTDLASREG